MSYAVYPSTSVTLPSDGRLSLHVRELDGTRSEIDLREMAPELLHFGSTLPELDRDEDETAGSDDDFAYFEIDDKAEFVVDGATVDLNQAAEYLERALLNALEAAARPS